MYPYSYPGSGYNLQGSNQQHVPVPSNLPANQYHPSSTSGMFFMPPNPQAFVYQQAPSMNYGGNVIVQHGVVPMHGQSAPIIQNPIDPDDPKEKQKRYKLEQQRKFRYFDKNKVTTVDSMLSDIVSSTGKSVFSQKKKPDDFGEFLQAASPSITSVTVDQSDHALKPIANGQGNISVKSTPSSSHVSVASHASSHHSLVPDVDLQSKMMESLDLSQSHHAKMKFKPIATQAQKKRPEKKTYQVSTKAADWSNLSVAEDEFQGEEPSPSVPISASPSTSPVAITNAWLTDLEKVPLVYKHVYEASLASDGLLDTPRLHSILLQCNLPNETLGKLWSMTNKSVPGRLNQRELFILLALIALTQGGNPNASIEEVIQLPSAPTPFLSAYADQPATLRQSKQSSVAVSTTTQPTNDDFEDFQDFQTTPVAVGLGTSSAFQPVGSYASDLGLKSSQADGVPSSTSAEAQFVDCSDSVLAGRSLAYVVEKNSLAQSITDRNPTSSAHQTLEPYSSHVGAQVPQSSSSVHALYGDSSNSAVGGGSGLAYSVEKNPSFLSITDQNASAIRFGTNSALQSMGFQASQRDKIPPSSLQMRLDDSSRSPVDGSGLAYSAEKHSSAQSITDRDVSEMRFGTNLSLQPMWFNEPNSGPQASQADKPLSSSSTAFTNSSLQLMWSFPNSGSQTSQIDKTPLSSSVRTSFVNSLSGSGGDLVYSVERNSSTPSITDRIVPEHSSVSMPQTFSNFQPFVGSLSTINSVTSRESMTCSTSSDSISGSGFYSGASSRLGSDIVHSVLSTVTQEQRENVKSDVPVLENAFSAFTPNLAKVTPALDSEQSRKNPGSFGQSSSSEQISEDRYAALSNLALENDNDFKTFQDADNLRYAESRTMKPDQDLKPELPNEAPVLEPMATVTSTLASSESGGSVLAESKSNTDKFGLFKSVFTNSPGKIDSSPVQSETVSVKSLDLNLSHAISQQSLGTLDQRNVNNQTPKSPQTRSRKYGPSFCDDDYDDFNDMIPPPDMPPDTFDEFDDFQGGGNSSLVDFDAFSSYEPPKKQTTLPPNPIVFSKQDDNIDDVSVSSDLFKGHGFDPEEQSKTTTMQQQQLDTPTPSPSPPSPRFDSAEGIETPSQLSGSPSPNIDKRSPKTSSAESIDINVDNWLVSDTAFNDLENYIDKWDKCLVACLDVISRTNQIISSIQTPSVCTEVVYSIKGQRFISDLSEVYGIAKRIRASMKKFKIDRDSLQNLHKQIELSWHNLMAFCSNVPVIDHSIQPNDSEGICGVCLFSLNGDTLAYAGKDYHSTCANFWVNQIDKVLPALEVTENSSSLV